MAATFLNWILHLDVHLAALAAQHGAWIYAILFLVIFVETGLVVMPFLPGDSLLFVSGALAAGGVLRLPELIGVLTIAAITGDAANYAVGAYVRRKAVNTQRIPLLKPEHLERTHAFFDRHGRKTIILARFVPVVRTLAPFVAALGEMPYRVFALYNVVGAMVWVISVAGAGYAFGNVPWIKNNLTAVILGIVILSVLPGIFGWLADKRNAQHARQPRIASKNDNQN